MVGKSFASCNEPILAHSPQFLILICSVKVEGNAHHSFCVADFLLQTSPHTAPVMDQLLRCTFFSPSKTWMPSFSLLPLAHRSYPIKKTNFNSLSGKRRECFFCLPTKWVFSCWLIDALFKQNLFFLFFIMNPAFFLNSIFNQKNHNYVSYKILSNNPELLFTAQSWSRKWRWCQGTGRKLLMTLTWNWRYSSWVPS